jgi:Ala-tRNA(Pro) deacylase
MGVDMEPQEQAICEKLKELDIAYEQSEHPALFTIEEMVRYGLDCVGEIPKNLFIRDASGKRHYLIVIRHDKQADLVKIRQSIGCSRLSFASEQRLKKYLNVSKGEVSPLALLFDVEKAVRVYLDRDLLTFDKLGVHPGVNTKTVWIAPCDLLRYLSAVGHDVHDLWF